MAEKIEPTGQMKDGGERVTYDGGAKREPHKGKGRFDWISPFALERVAKIGELMITPDSYCWVREVRVATSIANASFYINQWREGYRNQDYIAYAAWHIMDAIHKEETRRCMPLGGFEALSPYALERLAKWCELGGVKYGERNWEKGMPYDHPLDSALRHINCWRKGLKEEDNLAAVLWNLFALMHYEACHFDQFDNIPRYPEANKASENAKKCGELFNEGLSKGLKWEYQDKTPICNSEETKKFLSLLMKKWGNEEKTIREEEYNLKKSNPVLVGKPINVTVDLDFDMDEYIKTCDKLLEEARSIIGSHAKEVFSHSSEKRNYRIIVEDFDGTLCKNAWPEIGEPNWPEIFYVRRAISRGDRVILSTCREGDMLDKAVNWCRDKGIIFDAVNDNLPGQTERYGNNSRKIFGDEYRDDKAIRVEA